jgi:hypothetical protein
VSQGRRRTTRETCSDNTQAAGASDDTHDDDALSGATTVFAELGTSKREEQMSALVRKKLQVMDSKRWRIQLGNKSIGLSEQVEKAVTIIQLVKEFASPVASADPHAALAWAGVCILLPVSRPYRQFPLFFLLALFLSLFHIVTAGLLMSLSLTIINTAFFEPHSTGQS